MKIWRFEDFPDRQFEDLKIWWFEDFPERQFEDLKIWRFEDFCFFYFQNLKFWVFEVCCFQDFNKLKICNLIDLGVEYLMRKIMLYIMICRFEEIIFIQNRVS